MGKLDVKKVVFKEGPKIAVMGQLSMLKDHHPGGGVVDYGCRYPELRKQKKSWLRVAGGKGYNNYNGRQEREENHDSNIKVTEFQKKK